MRNSFFRGIIVRFSSSNHNKFQVMMKHIEKLYYLTLLLLIIILVSIFIWPDFFSLNFTLAALITLMPIFFVIDHFYKKKFNRKGNDIVGIIFFVLMLSYFAYTLYRHFQINPN